jgi:two-component system sensor histidine kinase DegS
MVGTKIMEQNNLSRQLKQALQEIIVLKNQNNNSKKKFQNFAQLLLKKEEDDRREISREIHDEIAQLLTAINFELAILNKEAEKSNQLIKNKIFDVQALISHSVEKIHQYARELRPMILDDLGLIPAMKSYIKEFSQKSNMKVNFKMLNDLSLSNDFNQTVLFRVMQESLSNISKHSKAKHVSITIAKLKRVIKLIIKDDGVGFNVKKIMESKYNKGLGLVGMQERVNLVRGNFLIM